MFFAVDPIDWALVRADLVGEIVWPKSLAIVDLRYLQDRALRPKGRFPSRRQLAADWGWSQSRVGRLLADVDSWSDPAKRDSWDEYYRNRSGPKPDQNRTKSEPKPDQNRTTRPPVNADNGESPDQNRTNTGPKADQKRTKSEHRRVVNTTTTTTTTTTTDKHDAIERVWSHFRAAWLRVHGSSLNHKPPKRGGLATVIREHGEPSTMDLIDWFETSTDDRATFLRERRIGHSTIFRPAKAATYITEWVEPWKQNRVDRLVGAKPKPSSVPNFARRFRVFDGAAHDIIDGE